MSYLDTLYYAAVTFPGTDVQLDTILWATLASLVVSLITGKFLKHLIIMILKKPVELTPFKQDDELLEDIKHDWNIDNDTK